MPPIRKGDGTPVTPKGISQIRTGDGRILFDGVAIADLAALYEFEDDDTTDVAEDSIADNDLTLVDEDPSYSTDAKVGSFALSTGSGERAESQQTVNPVQEGDSDGFAVMGWLKPAVADQGFTSACGWLQDNDNFLALMPSDGATGIEFQIAESNINITDANVSIDTNEYYHWYGEPTDGQLRLVVHDEDGNEITEETSSFGEDITDLGSGNYIVGGRLDGSRDYDGLTDDFGISFDPLSDEELDEVVARGV